MMSSVSSRGNSAWTDEPPPLVRWRRWPLRDNLLIGAMGIAGLVGAGVLVYWQTDRLHLAIGATLVVAIAAWRFFVPVTFELNAEGVHQWILGRHRRISWSEIRCHQFFSTGVLLLPYEQGSPIDVMHGLFLPWGLRRDEILAQLRYYLDPPLSG
jgi:hypothetical protein